jgi:hypothetical protein
MPAIEMMRACVAALLAATAFGAAAADAPCREDARKFCASVQPGEGRAIACLKAHESELTPACKAALPTLERCRQEVQTLCGSGSPRELRSCLRDNAAKLSPECRALRPAR